MNETTIIKPWHIQAATKQHRKFSVCGCKTDSCEGCQREIGELASIIAENSPERLETDIVAGLRCLRDAVTMPWVKTRLEGASKGNDIENALVVVDKVLSKVN
jgi:hypothetical protein